MIYDLTKLGVGRFALSVCLFSQLSFRPSVLSPQFVSRVAENI